jgi:crotonobetainyl-CoA:carnitine CoA-transferase CaiB-like acyl-CoA transferase
MEALLGVDIYAAPVNGLGEALTDPQVEHNEMVLEAESAGGPLRMVASPLRFSRTPAQVRSAPPLLGEHTAEILELAGFKGDEMDRLLASGAVGSPAAPGQRRKDRD